MKVNIKYKLLIACVVVFGILTAQSQGRWRHFASYVSPHPVATGFAPVNNIRMYYAVYGKGEPVLLIHGGLVDSDVWVYQVAALAKTHMVIVADTRGHGRSSRPNSPYNYDVLADDYLALLDYLKIEKVAVIGSSDGGIIGLNLAMKHPERLTKLFAQAANASVDGLLGDTPGTIRTIKAQMKARKATGSHKSAVLSYDDFVLAINFMWYSEPNWSKEQLAAIKVPTVIAIGDRDEEISLSHTRYMANAIPGAKLVILRHSNHGAMVQNPDVFNQAVLDFLHDPSAEPQISVFVDESSKQVE